MPEWEAIKELVKNPWVYLGVVGVGWLATVVKWLLDAKQKRFEAQKLELELEALTLADNSRIVIPTDEQIMSHLVRGGWPAALAAIAMLEVIMPLGGAMYMSEVGTGRKPINQQMKKAVLARWVAELNARQAETRAHWLLALPAGAGVVGLALSMVLK